METWLPSLVTDLALDKQGRCAITPFTAPSGQQKLRTFFEKPLEAVRNEPQRLLEALVGWRRGEGFTGEYLDHRVLRSNSDDTEGRPGREIGVPGATWLATMALPLLRITGDGHRLRATLWHRTGSTSVMLWPLWRPALDLPSVRSLSTTPHSPPATACPRSTPPSGPPSASSTSTEQNANASPAAPSTASWPHFP